MHYDFLTTPQTMKKTTTKATSRRRPRRDPNNTTITFSLPKELEDAVRDLAAAEGRNVSEYIRWQLAQIAGIGLRDVTSRTKQP